ncbi:hypothetical protein [Gracilimonas mengyeensis]|nr:hypothetical protein [Gracilimonas mengyeensis]
MKIIIISFLLLLMIGCQGNKGTNDFDFEKDTPQWLKAEIDSISLNSYYQVIKVYRYTWKGDFVYHFEIPISSCVFCDLYDQNGSKLTFNDDKLFEDFLENKHDKVLIWQRK